MVIKTINGTFEDGLVCEQPTKNANQVEKLKYLMNFVRLRLRWQSGKSGCKCIFFFKQKSINESTPDICISILLIVLFLLLNSFKI